MPADDATSFFTIPCCQNTMTITNIHKIHASIVMDINTQGNEGKCVVSI